MQMQHLSQKYLGRRPKGHADAMFNQDTMVDVEGGHLVPVSNFMNAQCKSLRMR